MRERITDLPILDLKLPSSVNQLWRTRRGKVFRSSTYDAWRKEACWELLAQRPGRVEGPVEVSIALGRPDARKRHLGRNQPLHTSDANWLWARVQRRTQGLPSV